MKKVLAVIGSVILVVAVFVGIGFGTGYLNVGYTQTVGKAQQNAENKVFHQTQAYVDGAVQDISKTKLEYDKSKDETAKKALVDYIQSTYANLDPSQINNSSIASWLRDIQNGSIN